MKSSGWIQTSEFSCPAIFGLTWSHSWKSKALATIWCRLLWQSPQGFDMISRKLNRNAQQLSILRTLWLWRFSGFMQVPDTALRQVTQECDLCLGPYLKTSAKIIRLSTASTSTVGWRTTGGWQGEWAESSGHHKFIKEKDLNRLSPCRSLAKSHQAISPEKPGAKGEA